MWKHKKPFKSKCKCYKKPCPKVKVKWLSPEKSEEYFGWDAQPCEIHLDNGTILSPSQDDEGNDAGAIFTNLKDLPCIPVFRD